VPFSIRLTPEEEALLDEAARRTSRSRSDLVRESLREYCLRLVPEERSAFSLGKGLFGAGTLAAPPRDPQKRAVWEKLRAKHQRLG
jgi:metal-responsive CopG/Arc/MetJ family transcriptional regulator